MLSERAASSDSQYLGEDALTAPDDSVEIGRRLRRIRQGKGVSARDLAERAGVTAAYLSRLENDKVSPTVASLTRVMQALGEPVAALFDEPAASVGPVVRASQRQVVRTHGVADYRITPASADRLEVLETVVGPGQGSGSNPYSHPGDQECALILQGSLHIWLAGNEYLLEAGDAITFACRSPHRWANTTNATTRALWIITPATY